MFKLFAMVCVVAVDPSMIHLDRCYAPARAEAVEEVTIMVRNELSERGYEGRIVWGSGTVTVEGEGAFRYVMTEHRASDNSFFVFTTFDTISRIGFE